jgi:Protein of unknown function (DUF3631)
VTARPQDLGFVLAEAKRFVRRFVVMSDHQAVAVALWVFHTHSFDASDYTPYLWVKSAERESGKSRLKEAVEPLVVRPEKTANISPAAVFRLAGQKPAPTFLIDELDEIFAPKSERSELRGLLNAGFRRGEVATRMVGEGAKMEVRRFEVYCPKLLAGKSTANLGDTLESRCIPIELQRKLRDEHVERFRLRDIADEAASLHQALSALAEHHVDALAAARPELPDELSDRQQDVWEPLLAISDLAGAEWPQQARSAAVTLSTGTELEESLGVHLLADCQTVFDGHEKLSTGRLVELLCELDSSPWQERWWDTYKGEPKAGATRNLGWHLRRYHVKAKRLRLDDDERPKGYERAQFEDAWRRYLPSTVPNKVDKGDNPHEQRDCGPSNKVDKPPSVPLVEQGSNPHGQSDVPLGPLQNPGNGGEGGFPGLGNPGFRRRIGEAFRAGHITDTERRARLRLHELVKEAQA